MVTEYVLVRITVKKGWRAPRIKREEICRSKKRAEVERMKEFLEKLEGFHVGYFAYFIEEEKW